MAHRATETLEIYNDYGLQDVCFHQSTKPFRGQWAFEIPIFNRLRLLLHPRAGVAAGAGVAPPIDVAAAQQRDDLAVVEAHPVEDLIADVLAEALPAVGAPLRVEALRDVLLRAGQPPDRRREGGAVAIATWRGRGRQEIESESASEERKWRGNVVKFRKLVEVEVES